MPIRTRDFLLYLLAAAFLVVAIVATMIQDVYPVNQQVASANKAKAMSEEVIYTADLAEKPTLDRAGHLASLRAKISKFKESFTNPVIETETAVVSPIITSTTKPEEIISTELKCPTYYKHTKEWLPLGLTFGVVEGARLVYRDVVVDRVLSSSSSSTALTEVIKEVVLQLPLQTYATAEKSCLRSDVVGIALDGSLILNNEYALYSIFGSETIVGYALDGFPIYGQSTEKTDACGGLFKAGQYRYFLSLERKAVLHCFAGKPIEI